MCQIFTLVKELVLSEFRSLLPDDTLGQQNLNKYQSHCWVYYLYIIDCIKTDIKKGERLPVLKATQCWQTYLFRNKCLHMSFDKDKHVFWPP